MKDTNWQAKGIFRRKGDPPSLIRRQVVVGGAALAGLTATSVPAQGQAQKAAQRYTNDERANFEAIDSYFNGLKLKDVSRIRFAPNVTFTTAIIP